MLFRSSCLERAHVSLRQAITTVESEGGRVLDANFRQEQELGCLTGNPGLYDMTLLAGGRIMTVSVDANTGQTGPRVESSAMSALLGALSFSGNRTVFNEAGMASLLPRLTTTMPEAVRMAEGNEGKAMVVWIEINQGRAGYMIKVVRDGRVRKVWIDGQRA